MAEYIEREDAIRKAKMANHDTNCGYVDWEQDERTELYINDIPTAAVRPVTHAAWIRCNNGAGYKCSNCKARVRISEVFNGNHNFCHKCGATMDAKMEVQDG